MGENKKASQFENVDVAIYDGQMMMVECLFFLNFNMPIHLD